MRGPSPSLSGVTDRARQRTPALTRATHLELDLPHLLLGAEDGPADNRREDVRRKVVAREAALDKLRWRRRSVREGAARTQMRAAAGDPHPGAIVANDRRLAHMTENRAASQIGHTRKESGEAGVNKGSKSSGRCLLLPQPLHCSCGKRPREEQREVRAWLFFTFHSLVMRRKYVVWRCALVCERLRCEPWRPWEWGETTRGPRNHRVSHTHTHTHTH